MNADSQSKPLADRVVLITGAAAGIGRALSLGCAAQGATVVLLDKEVKGLDAVYDQIEANGGPVPAIYPLHMEGASPKDYAEMAEKIDATCGRLDGLVHCAASLPYLSRLSDFDAEDWFKILQVNLNAPFLITQSCLPLLEQSPDPSVVFVSDAVGRCGKAFWGAYAVSKAGLEVMCQVLADELEHTGMRINSVDPGPTRTALRKRIFPGEEPESLKPPEKLLPLLLWLLGPDSRGVSGQALTYGDALPTADDLTGDPAGGPAGARG